MSWTAGRNGSTRQSRRLRAIVLTRWPWCYLQYEGCTGHATEDDHIIPITAGGTDHISNHRGACHTCHQAKSQHEATAARRTQTANTRHPRERHPTAR